MHLCIIFCAFLRFLRSSVFSALFCTFYTFCMFLHAAYLVLLRCRWFFPYIFLTEMGECVMMKSIRTPTFTATQDDDSPVPDALLQLLSTFVLSLLRKTWNLPPKSKLSAILAHDHGCRRRRCCRYLSKSPLKPSCKGGARQLLAIKLSVLCQFLFFGSEGKLRTEMWLHNSTVQKGDICPNHFCCKERINNIGVVHS